MAVIVTVLPICHAGGRAGGSLWSPYFLFVMRAGGRARAVIFHNLIFTIIHYSKNTTELLRVLILHNDFSSWFTAEFLMYYNEPG